MKREYLAILKKGSKRPSLMTTVDLDKIWWGEGPSYCYLSEEDQIVKSYGIFDDQQDDTDNIFLEFERDFPPEVGLRDSCGWLSPEGIYYPCGYMEHESIAWTIYAILWNDFGGGRELIWKGWAQISDGYIQYEYPFTQRQLDVLFDLSQVATGELKETCDRYLLIARERES